MNAAKKIDDLTFGLTTPTVLSYFGYTSFTWHISTWENLRLLPNPTPANSSDSWAHEMAVPQSYSWSQFLSCVPARSVH